MKAKYLAKNDGYTLIELLAATSIIVIVSGLIVGVLYSTLRGSNKTRVTNEVSQNGNFALSIISNTATNAENVTEVGGVSVSDCATPHQGTSIEFQNNDGRRIKFACDQDTQSIASTSAGVTTYLINNSVKVDPTTCNFSCIQDNGNPYSQPVITVKYTVYQKATTTTFENKSSSTFNTSITMRNYNPR